MIFKVKPKPTHIYVLSAVLFGLVVAGLWVFANSNPKTIIDSDPEKEARVIIDTTDEERKTIISPESLEE